MLNGAKNSSIWSVVGYSSPTAMNLPSGLGAPPCTASLLEVSRVQRRTARRKEYQWEVSRIGGKAAKLLGIVYARDEEQAFQKAVEDLGITYPHLQKRPLIRRAA